MVVRDDEIDLRDVIRVLRKRWMLILLPSLVAAMIAWAAFHSMPKQYESYALLRIGHIGTNPIESVASISEIMDSLSIRQSIADKMKNDDQRFIEALKSAVKYDDVAGLLKIRTRSSTPEKAQELAKAVTDVVISRHRDLYDSGLEDIDRTLKYVKTTVSPVPLSISINEIKTEPTRLETPAFVNKQPVRRKIEIIVTVVMMVVLLLTTLVAFYIEGKEND